MKIKEKEFESILQDLKQLAQEMGAKVRFERGDFKGGYCLLRDDKTIVINKLSTLQKKIMILTTALKDLGINDHYIQPKIREIIDEITEK
ncbi:MAG: hypothetical protein CVV24_07965 [Ignavibacteriae bacterium HGW-Ignavibacteriae-3]|nr:MAG: hypothetical protein CVV24_07965 [Ignavibacteriae bacterium HGW-Ignavibacteriae-3]